MLLALLVVSAFVGFSRQQEAAIHKTGTLTTEQKLALDKLKDSIVPLLPHDYMKTDNYLLPWLTDKKFNVEAATQALKENLMWRTENLMDGILKEDWADFDAKYKIHVEGCDNKKQPILLLKAKEWDIREAVVNGEYRRLTRYVDKLMEEGALYRRMQDNVTQITFILDTSDLSLIKQLCARCIPLYLYLINTVVRHYPGTAKKVFVVNTPEFVVPIWNTLIKPAVPESAADLITLYGRNPQDWLKDFVEQYDIARDQISPELGGTRLIPNLDFAQVRSTGLYGCEDYHEVLGANVTTTTSTAVPLAYWSRMGYFAGDEGQEDDLYEY